MSRYLFLLIFIIISCSEDKPRTNSTKESHNDGYKKIATSDNEIEDEEDGPPFKIPCPCSFNELGKIRVNKSRYEVLVSGIGWNPNLNSCDWEWGELIYNISPPDSNITEIRVHLVDLNKVNGKVNENFLKSKDVQGKLMATFINNWQNNDQLIDTVIYDPNNLGKYQKSE